jgi:allantoinase
LALLPGLVDTHVHINEPGRTDWEGFTTATRAAAAGGVTTLVDMPLNSIPATTTVAGVETKRAAARGKCRVDVRFWGGVVPGNRDELAPLARAGVLGFKCFLCPSGVDEFPHVTERDLREALPIIAELGLPLLVHAELPEFLPTPRDSDNHEKWRQYSTWLESRPVESEAAAVNLVAQLSAETGARIHIVHVSSIDALDGLSKARAAGASVTTETCPHYLTFAAEDVPDGATAFKCAPPIRQRVERERLWDGLIRGDINLIATDHSPAPPGLKLLDEGDFLHAWGGIASLQLGLAAVWTGACQRGIALERLGQWLCSGPAELAGLSGTKGTIAVGHRADLVVFDPEATFTVRATELEHRHAVTPYDGMRLRGRVMRTILAGETIFER